MASEPTALALRPSRQWLLIGIPVLLLFGRGVRALFELSLAETPPDRIGVVIGLALLSMAVAVALLLGGRWGWVLAIGILGWDLAAELALWWFGSPDYIAMALLALCAFLLTTPEMRAAFTGPSRR